MTQFNFRWNFLGAMNRVLRDWYRDDHATVCEWGTGYSTFVYDTMLQSRAIDRLISIEQYEPYLEDVRKELSGTDNHHVLLSELFEVDRLAEDGSSMLYYTTAPLSLGVPIDLALVDGRARSECLLVAALASGPEAVLLLDDSERARYIPALQFFDIVDRQLRFAVLKVKSSYRSAFSEFAVSLDRFNGKPVAKPKPGRKGGMGHVPELSQLGEQEKADLAELIRQAGSLDRIVAWCEDDVVDTIRDAARTATLLQISDRSLPADASIEHGRIAALITGRLDDQSRDPMLHYSTAPLAEGGLADLVVIAGHRRNECAITALHLLKSSGYVAFRDGRHLHHAPGLALFERIGDRGSWTFARVRKDLWNSSEEAREELRVAVKSREVSLPR